MKVIFLDTNVILDLLQHRADFNLAAQIFQQASEGMYKIVTSTLSMVNVAYVLRKTYHGEDLYNHLSNIAQLLGVIGVSTKAYSEALDSRAKDFEDAIQLYSAKEAGASCLVTRNIKDFNTGILPIYEPRQFLDL